MKWKIIHSCSSHHQPDPNFLWPWSPGQVTWSPRHAVFPSMGSWNLLDSLGWVDWCQEIAWYTQRTRKPSSWVHWGCFTVHKPKKERTCPTEIMGIMRDCRNLFIIWNPHEPPPFICCQPFVFFPGKCTWPFRGIYMRWSCEVDNNKPG